MAYQLPGIDQSMYDNLPMAKSAKPSLARLDCISVCHFNSLQWRSRELLDCLLSSAAQSDADAPVGQRDYVFQSSENSAYGHTSVFCRP